jgi:small subunit ribosomal protein S18
MPSLLPSPCAMRGISARAFSTTAAARAPPRGDSHQRHSSTSSLLSINNPTSSSRSSGPPRSGGQNAYKPSEAASDLMTRFKRSGQPLLRTKQAQLDMMRNQKNSNDYLKQMPRRWDAGDVYSPHDMSPVEMQKWRKRSPRGGDVVDALGIRPLDMYKVWLLSIGFPLPEIEDSMGAVTANVRHIELLLDPGIYLYLWPDHSLIWHESASRQPAQDCQDDPTSSGHGSVPDYSCSPGDGQGQLLP